MMFGPFFFSSGWGNIRWVKSMVSYTTPLWPLRLNCLYMVVWEFMHSLVESELWSTRPWSAWVTGRQYFPGPVSGRLGGSKPTIEMKALVVSPCPRSGRARAQCGVLNWSSVSLILPGVTSPWRAHCSELVCSGPAAPPGCSSQTHP